MSDPLAPHLRELKAYAPGKPIDELRRELGINDVVKLASNENPYGPSPSVIARLREAPSLHLYPDPTGYDLKEALGYHHAIDPDELCLGNGSNELIDLICRVFAAPQDHAVFGDPSFLCYRIGCVAEQLEHTAVVLRDHLHWNVDDLLAAVTNRTKLLFVANPNNPTGSYIGEQELRRLLSSLPPAVIAVIDEAYVEFPDASDYSSALQMRGLRERLITLRTFSKAYGLAGLRVGYAVAPKQLIASMNRLRAPFNVSSIAQFAATLALQDQDHLTTTVRAIQADRQRLSNALSAMNVPIAPSQANFVLAKMPRGGRPVYEDLLRHGVIVRSMAPPIDDWIRITVGTPVENDRFLKALSEVLRR